MYTAKDIGSYDVVFEWYKHTWVESAGGIGLEETYVLQDTVWARVHPLSAMKLLVFSSITGKANVQIRVRGLWDIKSTDKLYSKYGTEIYLISDVFKDRNTEETLVTAYLLEEENVTESSESSEESSEG